MAKAKTVSARKQLLRLSAGRVEIATSVILAMLWQAKATAAEANVEGLAPHDPLAALPGEASLIAAIDRDAAPSITLDELRALMTPDDLGRLGLDPETFGVLLGTDPKAAILKLDAAFKAKVTLAAAKAPTKMVASTDAAGGGSPAKANIDADDGGGSQGSGGGSGILYVLGGLLGAGGAGVALSGGGGGSAAPPVTVPTPPAVNAAPTATTDSGSTAEDTAITLDVRSNDSDANNDPLSVTAINGTAITTDSAVATTGGTISLGSDGRLTFTPATNFNGPVSFTYTVADGRGGTATATANITVTAANDAPVNAGPSATVAASQATTVAITGLSISDVDAGTSVLTTTLAVGYGVLFGAVVDGGASLAGSGSASLTLTGTLAQINATLAAITYRGGASFAGSDSLSVTTSDGSASDTDSYAITVTAVQSGIISDGYIAGGTVFIDVNGNGSFDTGEPTTQTDGAGNFSIVSNAVGPIIAFGGVNADTGLPNLITMSAPAGSTVVNPLTTIVQQLMSGGASLADANASVAAAFGLPAGTDFGSFDILAASDPVLGLAAQKAATTVATLLTLAQQGAEEGSEDSAEAAILDRLVALADAGPVDLSDPGVLNTLFSGVDGINQGAVANIVATGGTILADIAAASTLGNLVTVLQTAPTPVPNHAPIAVADSVSTGLGTAVTFNAVANDTDAEGHAITVTAIDGTPISLDNPVTVEGGSIALNGDGSLTFTPNTGFAGSPQFSYSISDGNTGIGTGQITVAVTPEGSTVAVDPADIGAFAGYADNLAGAGVTSLDVIGDAATLSDADASALVGAGIAFAEADDITVAVDGAANGTQLSTSMKGLQDLNVDAVAVGVGFTAISVDAGAAGLGGLSATGLPDFTALQSDGAVDVTLNLAAGTIDPSLDLGALAPALAAAGIDHLDVTGGGLTLTGDQAEALGAAGLSFADAADVTMVINPEDIAEVASRAAEAAAGGIDHLDINGDALTLSDAEAGELVGAGLDFAEADQITVAAEGTHLATTLKGLQDLNVDTVALGVGIGMLSVNAGAEGFGGVSASPLPNFSALSGDPDITLTQASGTLDAGVDLGALAPSLAAAGIDHLGVTGDGALSVTLGQAGGLTGTGVDFATGSDITVSFTAGDVGTAAARAGDLAAINVDHLHVVDGTITISDSQAGQFIAAGLDFAADDDVSVAAQGTHLSTTLKGLQDLSVDSVSVEPGVQSLYIAAGDLAGIAANGLPQFDVAQNNAALDVTLAVTASDLGELPRLAEALAGAGVDHIAIDVPLDSLDGAVTAMLAEVTGLTGIDFVEQVSQQPQLFAAALEEYSAGDAPGQSIELNDSVIASITQSGLLGAYLAEVVTVDATSAGDKPLTSLKSVADLQIDAVHLADQHANPVYIDLGIDGAGAAELSALIASLDPGTGYQKIFTGSDHVALVIDAETADQLAGVDGALGHLAQLGFTEIDVLAGTDASLLAGQAGIEVKLIGQDDDLYDYLNHGRA